MATAADARLSGWICVLRTQRNQVKSAILGGIVLIRTFLSFSLEVEVSGHWPWQKLNPDGPSLPKM